MEKLPEIESLSLELGSLAPQLTKALLQAQTDNLVTRMWERDYTLWKPEPEEISNRLGWLDIAKRNQNEIEELQPFAEAVKAEGITGALLLGMGGSSLAPDLYGRIFDAKANGIPVDVLDSTDPRAVLEKAKLHDPANTLFIVSSKSGGTAETLSFFKFFYNETAKKLGSKKADSHFVAITDPGSKLAKLGEELGFRNVFLADPSIGGRYSALSKFGLVPAALIGLDLKQLLHSAEEMANRCHAAQIENNPGAMLGLALGSLAMAGHDKATFQLPERFASFADWVEQLIAESTGKEGKGILPIAHEPELPTDAYGDDRIFIGLGLTPTDSPALTIAWDSETELGGQFFLWEFATAVAGYVLDINAFDQPNVEAAKVQARHFIEQYQQTGKLPEADWRSLGQQEVQGFLSQATKGDYIALQAYTAPHQALTEALQGLRKRIGSKYQLATTLGYGPRFLHSTGQLHKGDAGNGLFIQLVSPPPSEDLPIPNSPGKDESDISFGVLKVAQALGDAHALKEAGRRVISFQVDEPTLIEQLNEIG